MGNIGDDDVLALDGTLELAPLVAENAIIYEMGS
jgi:hypothetical protein